MQLKDFYDYKERLMYDLLTNQKIVKLIDEDMSVEDAKSLVYKQVFPYEYVPETIQDGKTYICCDVDIQQSYNKTFLAPVLYIWILAHKSALRLKEGGVRTDALCNEICEAINGSRYYGLGEMNLYSVKRFAPMMDYQGKFMTFHMKEFNRQYNGARTIPSNRKKWEND